MFFVYLRLRKVSSHARRFPLATVCAQTSLRSKHFDISLTFNFLNTSPSTLLFLYSSFPPPPFPPFISPSSSPFYQSLHIVMCLHPYSHLTLVHPYSHLTLVHPYSHLTLVHPYSHLTLVHPYSHLTLVHPYSHLTLVHPYSHLTLVHPYSHLTLVHPYSHLTLVHPYSHLTLVHPYSHLTLVHPYSHLTLVHPCSHLTLVHPYSHLTLVHPYSHLTLVMSFIIHSVPFPGVYGFELIFPEESKTTKSVSQTVSYYAVSVL